MVWSGNGPINCPKVFAEWSTSGEFLAIVHGVARSWHLDAAAAQDIVQTVRLKGLEQFQKGGG